jgi:hypothetical protein
MVGGLLGEIEAARRVGRVRRVCAVGVLGVLLLAGGLLLVRPTGAGVPAPPAPTSPAVQLVLWGERHSAEDPATGLSGTVGLEGKQWGTHVGLELSHLKGPLKCSLVAVSTRGEREVVTTWTVPTAGYGVPGQPQDLIVHGGAAIPLTDLDRLEVAAEDGRTLLSIPTR